MAKRRLPKAFYDSIRTLKKECPLSAKVSVRRILFNHHFGYCKYKPSTRKGIEDKFLIRIDKRLSTQWAIRILVHEWAHAMVWFSPAAEGKEGDHHAEWGVAYARCYRAIFDD